MLTKDVLVTWIFENRAGTSKEISQCFGPSKKINHFGYENFQKQSKVQIKFSAVENECAWMTNYLESSWCDTT